jgi:hypothetical protein
MQPIVITDLDAILIELSNSGTPLNTKSLSIPLIGFEFVIILFASKFRSKLPKDFIINCIELIKKLR